MGMALPFGLDLDLLRSFVVIAEEKSFTRAAERVGRTQSAVSLQIQRLEAVLGQTVLTRGKGGNVELNQQGQYLLVRAREILALNDDIVRSLSAPPLHGTVRLGFADDIPGRYLSRILERFAEQVPAVEVELSVTVSCALGVKLKAGELDVALIEGGLEPRQWPAEEVWRQPLRWITSDIHQQHLRDPLPLSLAPSECQWRPPWLTACLWRSLATRELEKCGRSYRIVSTANTTAGQLAAVSGGTALTVCMAGDALPEGLRAAGLEDGLPNLPDTNFLLMKGRDPRQPMTDLLAALIVEAFSEETDADPA